MKHITALRGTSVFVVIEFNKSSAPAIINTTTGELLSGAVKATETILHGVYSNRDTANAKAVSVGKKNQDHGYIAVLKKTIEGKKELVEHVVCKDFNFDEYRIKG